MRLVTLKNVLFAAGLSMLITASGASARPRGIPGIEGIPNFARVNETLFRGAEPAEPGIQALKALGVKTVIDLRSGKEVSKQEQDAARLGGIVYTNVPLRGLGRPTEEQVARILNLVDTLPSPVFIHCQHGCDRTGTIVACYRIAREQWTSAEALAEAKRFGMSVFERGMRHYIRAFGRNTRVRSAFMPSLFSQATSPGGAQAITTASFYPQ